MEIEMEQAVRFGRDNHLVGVLSRSEQSDGARIVAILPNAGFMPRIGPFRLHVFLARALAKARVDTLRFDLSGLGDSSTPRSREQLLQRKNADLVDAVSLIQAKRKPSRILLIGLCSGAIDSHRVALVDDRVDGIVMLDPVAYPDRLYHILSFCHSHMLHQFLRLPHLP